MECTEKQSFLDLLMNMILQSDDISDQISIIYFIILNKTLSETIIQESYWPQFRNIIHALCEKGYVNVMKILYFNLLSDLISLHFNEFFLTCCKNGHLEMAKWLHDNNSDDTLNLYMAPFQRACSHGHLKVMKWLWSLGKIDRHDIDDKSFIMICTG